MKGQREKRYMERRYIEKNERKGDTGKGNTENRYKRRGDTQERET